MDGIFFHEAFFFAPLRESLSPLLAPPYIGDVAWLYTVVLARPRLPA